MGQADSARSGSLTFERVLEEEFRFLDKTPGSNSAVSTDRGNAKDDRPADVSAHDADGHSALCLSGGGIRSASFNLGLLQGLAQAGLLDSFDYLSTVSGGGYIGGWLNAWRTRARQHLAPDPARSLAVSLPADQSHDADPLSRLRLNVALPRSARRRCDRSTSGRSRRSSCATCSSTGSCWCRCSPRPPCCRGCISASSACRHSRSSWPGRRWPRWYYHDWLVCLPLFGIAALLRRPRAPQPGEPPPRAAVVSPVLPRAGRARRDRHLRPPLLGVAVRRGLLASQQRDHRDRRHDPSVDRRRAPQRAMVPAVDVDRSGHCRCGRALGDLAGQPRAHARWHDTIRRSSPRWTCR